MHIDIGGCLQYPKYHSIYIALSCILHTSGTNLTENETFLMFVGGIAWYRIDLVNV